MEKESTYLKELTQLYVVVGDLHTSRRHARCTQDGREVKDVALPPWAENSPSKIVAGMRSALDGTSWFHYIYTTG